MTAAPNPFLEFDHARFLVADDDPILREFACVHLATPTVDVEAAEDGEEAHARLQSGSYDLLLLDLDMPRLDGFGLLERLRADPRWRDLPVVVITGREDIAAIDRAFALGATSFVVKPLNWRLLSHQLLYVMRASRNEALARDARADAERSDAVKANLLRMTRHELATPLHAIAGFSALIGETAHDSATRDHAQAITAAAARLKTTLDDLQLAARLFGLSQPPSTQIARVPDIVRGAARMATTRAGRSDGLKLVDRTRGADVECDQTLTTDALARLIDNGLRHTAGPVEVSAALDGLGRLVLEVRDGGPGLQPGEAERLIQPFAQADDILNRRSEGLGLGLAIVSSAIRLQGGTLTLENRPGGGLSAQIVLLGGEAMTRFAAA